MENIEPQVDLVSVVTVTFNNQVQLQDTIISVAEQNHPNLEHLVIDGGSTDGTAVFLSCADSVDNWVSEPDEGIYDAMNKGVEMCSLKSRYVIFMNAGDKFAESTVISEIIERVNDTEAHLYGDIIREGEVIRSPDKLTYYSLSTNMVCHQAILFKTDVLRKILYDKSFRLCSDYKLLLDLLKGRERFEKINIIFADYDIGGVSSVQRGLLQSEKQIIRKQYPVVYFWYLVKKIIREIMSSKNNE